MKMAPPEGNTSPLFLIFTAQTFYEILEAKMLTKQLHVSHLLGVVVSETEKQVLLKNV